MFDLLKKISPEEAPKIRALFAGLNATLTYALLLWFIYSVNGLNWALLAPLCVLGIISNVYFSWIEDKKSLQEEGYGSNNFLRIAPIISNVVLWVIIWYFVSIIVVSKFAFILLTVSCILYFVKLLFAIYIYPKLLNNLKRFNEIRKNIDNKAISYQTAFTDLISEEKIAKKTMIQAVVFAIIPALLATGFLWWGFYYIIASMEISVKLIMFIFFVTIFELVLHNISKKLKNQIISKNITK